MATILDEEYFDVECHVSPFISMKAEDSDNIAAFGGCKFDLLDGEGSLIRTGQFGDKTVTGTPLRNWPGLLRHNCQQCCSLLKPNAICRVIQMCAAAHEWNNTGDRVGLPDFMEAESVLQHLIDTRTKDLYLRAQIHVKGVPVQEADPNAAATQLLTVLTDLKDTSECVETQHEDKQDKSELSRVPSSVPPPGAGSGTLRFASSNSVHITMPLVATGEERPQSLEQHRACYSMLLENPCSRFAWMPNVNSSNPSVAIHIEGSLMKQIPLLRVLREETVVDHLDESQGASSTASSKATAQTKEHPTDEDESRCSTPFNPPASICGIACVMMLVEVIELTHQRMILALDEAIEAEWLQAASYLGHKQVERLVSQRLYCVVLSMLAADDANGMSKAPKDIKKIARSLRQSKRKWEQVFGLLPAHTLKVIVDDLITLLPGDSLNSKVLKLPVAIIDQWIESCNGVISLQSTTVPDAACVLKLIDRLPHHPEVEVLHIPKIEGGELSTEDTVRVLEALDLAIPSMPKMRVLGLSNLTLTIQNVHEVISILSIVRDRLQGVALRFDREFKEFKSRVEAARVLFQVLFRAIGKMSKLQTLQLGHWEEGVSKEHFVGLKPLNVLLSELPSAKYVVSMAVDAPGLKFHKVGGIP